MFKHILLPTDGSELSEAAIRSGIQFARSIDARVTGFHVIPSFETLTVSAAILEDTEEQYEKHARQDAEQYLAVIEKAAQAAGVACDTAYVMANHAYAAIIQAAEEKGCDLILMASHGRKGMRGLLIGSETTKVLTHTKLPVLVFR